MPDREKVFEFISTCQDPASLRSLIKNAKNEDDSQVEYSAVRRLIALVPSEEPGTLHHDFWQTIQAFEYALTEERGRTTRLSRTRQKVSRVGVLQTLQDWALAGQKTEGFDMLLQRGMPELSGEAVILRHPGMFDVNVVDAAKRRLAEAGIDLSEFEAPPS